MEGFWPVLPSAYDSPGRSAGRNRWLHHSSSMPKRRLSLAHTGRWYWLTKLISCDGLAKGGHGIISLDSHHGLHQLQPCGP